MVAGLVSFCILVFWWLGLHHAKRQVVRQRAEKRHRKEKREAAREARMQKWLAESI